MNKEEQKEYYSNIGKNLKLHRKGNNLTLAEVGKIIGVTPQQVSKYEAGQSKFPAAFLLILSQCYDIAPEALTSKNTIPEKQELKKHTPLDTQNNIIGRKLKAYRVLHNKTQADIALILKTSFQQYQKYEQGKNAIPIASLCILASEYNTSLENLITENDIVFSMKEEPKE